MKSKKSNRQAIQGGPVDDVKDYVPPNVPKSDSARALIYKAIKPNVLFRTCDQDELNDLIDSFQSVTHVKGSIVIQEGDKGDGFYVLSKGSVSVYEQAEYKVTMSPGSGFGEIALLYSCPRTASIKAEEDCKLWRMDRRAFRVIMSRHKKKRLKMKLVLLEKVNWLCDVLTGIKAQGCLGAARRTASTPGNKHIRQVKHNLHTSKKLWPTLPYEQANRLPGMTHRRSDCHQHRI